MQEPDSSLNHLLGALPEPDRQRWQAKLQVVDLPLGRVLNEAGTTPDQVYFPTTAIVSLLFQLADGGSAEFSVVGNDGMVGISLLMGGGTSPSRAVVRSPGRALRLEARFVEQEFRQRPTVTQLLLRYIQALITQMGQTAVCNRHHLLDQRLCRWLLLSLDRLPGRELLVTQELMASALGVRREGVTEAALKLQTAGLIRYARGHVAVLDRQGLERRSCECYAVIQREHARLLPGAAHAPAAVPARVSPGPPPSWLHASAPAPMSLTASRSGQSREAA